MVYCSPMLAFCISIVDVRASNACILCILVLLFKCFQSSIQMLLTHMLHGHLFIFEQVFIVVHTYASTAYASWTLAYF